MEMCSITKKKMQERAKKEAKKGMRKSEYRKSIVFQALHIPKSGNRENPPAITAMGKKKQNTSLLILNRRNTENINLHTTRQAHTITRKSTLKK